MGGKKEEILFSFPDSLRQTSSTWCCPNGLISWKQGWLGSRWIVIKYIWSAQSWERVSLEAVSRLYQQLLTNAVFIGTWASLLYKLTAVLELDSWASLPYSLCKAASRVLIALAPSGLLSIIALTGEMLKDLKSPFIFIFLIPNNHLCWVSLFGNQLG